MKIISYNVNGIRAAIRKGFLEWLSEEKPDVVCLQETKATPDQVPVSDIEALGYQTFWETSTIKKGYSGVAIFSKPTPKHVDYGIGIDKYDQEGRVIRADYEDFSVMSVYMPSGTMGDVRQAFKMQWLADFQSYINELKQEKENLIISGDYNICHRPIDIHDPVRNKNSTGFLPEEREWVSGFIESGFIDTFRFFNQEPNHYTWWSYRAGARQKNLGWRIDYHMASDALKGRLKNAAILPQAHHSDHCPIVLEIA
ncbi:exodeoxyribonuclease III [Tunicatimonas pelagia]|uniref:exodeoxyribonuclease III n=1 Tax=Tunicatimonas pelagia TaxID=931531 RepID=UPI002665AFAD|nr:exodeoxyribonuclease III [Tunicatimonas pelagia]WKN46102.1 exodeoxyribonuclease III [Tunicatimonas pelagia]